MSAQLPVLAGVQVRWELPEHAQIGEALEDLGWLFGDVYLMEDGLVAEPCSVQLS